MREGDAMTGGPGNLPYAIRIIASIQSIGFLPWSIRKQLLNRIGFRIAGSAFIESGACVSPGELTIGDHSYVNKWCLLDCSGGIEIGARTLIGPRVTILTTTHAVMDGYPRTGPSTLQRVTIADDAWIGAGSILLPGSVVERGSVVAAGAVVRGRVPRDTVCGGVPARPLRNLPAPGLDNR